jgi:hypothetical protein
VKEYFCIELKFKDKKISSKTFHAHLFVTDEEMYIQIIDNEVGSQIDRNFMVSKGSHGLFENNFEITGTEVALFFRQKQNLQNAIVSERCPKYLLHYLC